jgi:hypothetical protein
MKALFSIFFKKKLISSIDQTLKEGMCFRPKIGINRPERLLEGYIYINIAMNKFFISINIANFDCNP